ncbi:flagellar motor switch protein FliN [Campylobacter sp. RM12327]|uniref:flagellar motor switch protein FliN n=1 Tax=Campylobacter sputorum TaxID=206 RepID=UPI00053C067E|nr:MULTISPECIES: flagellar motor switch protein FliN [Campylobacter]ASM37878.1 flagellar motor switch protein [Campylobacter sputorum bv. paraureolyticus LMG 11764]ASM39538.1 flagellar motor switch protein [Campylobacter sputorum]MBE7358701.1 flagellar motor switch protein FliN [Campylobacter sp. RM11302]MBF6669823.1 flagellar motor switch protein FliN [Campylobacter sp. RM12327]MBF6675025.1 flagellar motor switch protein FliN [Campylobacter sp. RM13538]
MSEDSTLNVASEAISEGLFSDYSELLDISVYFTAELGTTTLSVKEFMNLENGSVIDLEKPAGESVELYINNRIFGKGEVMVYEKNLAIRINEILDSKSVVQYFKKEL